MRIQLIEPYFTGSHRAWAEGYAASSAHDVTLVTHQGRFWKWRMQGAAVTLAGAAAEHVAAHGRPDLILASSMTDLAALLGIAGRSLGGVPAVLYMHENQLTYPVSPRDGPDATYPMIQWKAMAAADLVVFNSDFHRRAWFEALPTFLGQFPDHRHDTAVVDSVAQRCEMLPVGVDLARLDGSATRTDPPLILWNQRAEHDKGPDEFAAAILAVDGAGVDFRLALAGERFVSEPGAFDVLRARLAGRIVHDAYADDRSYVDLLRAADIVVSTARQEFFGVAITEAVYAGAFPLLPDRLVYPERIPPAYHHRCLYDGHGDLVAKLVWAVAHRGERRAVAAALRAAMAGVDWSVVAPRYDRRFERVAAAGHG